MFVFTRWVLSGSFGWKDRDSFTEYLAALPNVSSSGTCMYTRGYTNPAIPTVPTAFQALTVYRRVWSVGPTGARCLQTGPSALVFHFCCCLQYIISADVKGPARM